MHPAIVAIIHLTSCNTKLIPCSDNQEPAHRDTGHHAARDDPDTSRLPPVQPPSPSNRLLLFARSLGTFKSRDNLSLGPAIPTFQQRSTDCKTLLLFTACYSLSELPSISNEPYNPFCKPSFRFSSIAWLWYTARSTFSGLSHTFY